MIISLEIYLSLEIYVLYISFTIFQSVRKTLVYFVFVVIEGLSYFQKNGRLFQMVGGS